MVATVELPAWQLRLVHAARAVLDRYGLLLAGGHALRAHGCAARPAGDLCFATAADTPLPRVADAVAAAYRHHGLSAEVRVADPRTAQVTVTDGTAAGRVELLREALRDRPFVAEPCPVVGLDDAVGLAVRALHNRGLPSDFVDVAAVADRYAFRMLERLGALHEDDWRTEDLLQRLETVDALADEAFAACGLVDEAAVAELRRFAYAWVENIKLRRVDDGDTDADRDVPELD